MLYLCDWNESVCALRQKYRVRVGGSGGTEWSGKMCSIFVVEFVLVLVFVIVFLRRNFDQEIRMSDSQLSSLFIFIIKDIASSNRDPSFYLLICYRPLVLSSVA